VWAIKNAFILAGLSAARMKKRRGLAGVLSVEQAA
jgi:hypothetical protein